MWKVSFNIRNCILAKQKCFSPFNIACVLTFIKQLDVEAL